MSIWQQIAERKVEWIGGQLVEDGGSSVSPSERAFLGMDQNAPDEGTKIVDIEFLKNGKDSMKFMVYGENFSCGFDVHFGGVNGSHPMSREGWLCLSGYGGHSWRIKKPEKATS